MDQYSGAAACECPYFEADIFGTEENLLTYLKLKFSAVFVRMGFLTLLCGLQHALGTLDSQINVGDPIIGARGVCKCANCRTVGMLTVSQVKRRSAYAFLVGVIQCELCEWQKFIPVVLFGGHKVSQVLLNHTVDTFSLPVALRVERCGHFQFCSGYFHDTLPEVTGELRVTITHNRGRHTMVADNLFDKEVCHVHCGNFR